MNAAEETKATKGNSDETPSADKPKIAFYWCASCGGCEEAVVDLAEDILGVVEAVDIAFWPVALDFKRKDVEAMADEVLGLLDDLAATAPDAPADERRVLFKRAVKGVELEFESVPPKTGKRMRRKLRKARVALPEALVLAASVLPQRQNLVTCRPPS